MESKVYDASIKLYSEAGWAGYNFDQIAKLSGVGKAAIYSRWPTREALLRATFDLRWDPVADIDSGSLRGDLEALTALVMNRYMGTRGGIVLNMQADGRRYAEFRSFAAPFSALATGRAMAILERARQRGEIAEDVDLDVAVNMIFGPLTARVARIELRPHALTKEEAEVFTRHLVDLLMRALAPSAAPR